MKKVIILLSFTVLFSCDEFLDVIPTGKVIPSTVEDLNDLLSNRGLSFSNWVNLAYMDPDNYMPDQHYIDMWQPHWQKQYIWHEDPLSQSQSDGDWNSKYKYIMIYNEVIGKIDDAPLGKALESDRTLIKGDALAQRAMDFFILVNEYGPHYSSSTLDVPAIPIPLEVDLQANLLKSTVGEVYTQILADLTEAEQLLSSGPAYRPEMNYRPGMASVKALFATIYLYMGDFVKAEQYSEESLALFDIIYDFNEVGHINPDFKWDAFDNDREWQYVTSHKSVSWNRTHKTWFYDPAHLYHPSLRDLYNHTTDRRWFLHADTITWYNQKESTLPDYVFVRDYAATNCGMQTSRTMLQNAEAKVRNGKGQEAIDMLNELAIYRYTTRDTTFTYTSNEAALQEIKDERRREFCFTGITFIDYKRYHAYGETIPTFSRTLPDGETFTLEPGSDKYIVPIARSVRSLNPNL